MFGMWLYGKLLPSSHTFELEYFCLPFQEIITIAAMLYIADD